MSVGKSGGSQQQSGQSSGTQTGSNSGLNYDVNNGTSYGAQSGTSSSTPTTTAQFDALNNMLTKNFGSTGLNPGQQSAADAWSNYIGKDPNNGVWQMINANNKLTPYTNTQAHTVAAPGAITAPGGNEFAANYQNPYTQQVVDATTGDALNSLKMGLNDINSNYGGTLGNGRGQVAAGQAVGDFTRGLTNNIAGLRSQGFDTSQQLGQGDASRQFGANSQNVGNTMNANQFNAGAQNLADQTNINTIQQQANNGAFQLQAGAGALQQQYNMAGGGNQNLFQLLGLQPQGQTNTSTGTQAGGQNNTSYGINLNDLFGTNQSTSSGSGSSKGGGITAG